MEQEAELARLKQVAEAAGQPVPAALNPQQQLIVTQKVIDTHVKREKVAVFQVG